MAQFSDKVAKRYAKALFELCEHTRLDAIRDQLRAFSQVWQSTAELREAVLNPAYPIKERLAAVAAVAGKTGVSDPKAINLISLLAENRRLGALGSIIEIFSGMIDELRRSLALTVTSAFPVSAEEAERVKDSVQTASGGLATVAWQVDPSLIGGLRIKIGDRILDTSIRNSLEKIRNELTA